MINETKFNTSNSETLIFFGKSSVIFSKSDGEFIPFISSDWHEDKTNDQSVLSALQRSQRQKGGNSLQSGIVVPAIPAIDYTLRKGSDMQQYDSILSSLPDLLKECPLIKTSPCVNDPLLIHSQDPSSEQQRQEYVAVPSGTRSALIKLPHHSPNKWYRLKGCGNHHEGFPVRTHPATFDSSSWQEIRGCAFHHTTIRELKMTNYLQQHLALYGMVSANSPIGYYQYSSSKVAECLQQQQPLSNDGDGEVSAVIPTCIIHETIGDRRLGSHLLAGLALLLPSLLDYGMLASVEELLACFPAERPSPICPGDILVTTAELMTDYALVAIADNNKADNKAVYGITWPDTPRDERVFVQLMDGQHLPEVAPSLLPGKYPLQWTRDRSQPMSALWQPIWDEKVNELQAILQQLHFRQQALAAADSANQQLLSGKNGSASSASSILPYLYAHLGQNVGQILHGMHHTAKVIWGTYQDRMCHIQLDEWHCNAHANNLVIVPPSSSSSSSSNEGSYHPFLAYVDLDMAFHQDSYLDLSTAGCTLADTAATGTSLSAAAAAADPADPASTTASTAAGTAAAIGVGMSDESFAALAWREHVNMMEVLVGGDASTGVPMIAKQYLQDKVYNSSNDDGSSSSSKRGQQVQIIQTMLYDTLLLHYLQAYNNDNDAAADKYEDNAKAATEATTKATKTLQ